MSDPITSDDIAAAVAPPAEDSSSQQTSESVTDDSRGDTAATTPTTAASSSGGIPPERHKEILEHTRREYTDKLDRLSWADKLDRARVERALELEELYERQPERLYEHLSTTVKKPAAAPQPDLQTEDGKPLYSASQAAALARYEAEQASAALEARFVERFGPIEEGFKRGQQTAAIESQIQVASEWPGFSDHMDAVTDAIAQANARHERLSLHEAYIRVVVPKLASSEKEMEARVRKAILDEMNQASVAAKDTVNPGRRAPVSHKADSDKTVAELLEEEYRARKAG